MLKIMPRCFEFDDDNGIIILSVWINFPGLPLDCWNPNAVNKIASKVEISISTDKLNSTKGRLSFARVLVNVDISNELVHLVKCKLPTSKS